jgi:hypothetical protein
MAGLALLDGTTAAIDMTLAFSGTNQVSVKCAFNRISARMNRGFTDRTTFCSTGWVEEIPGMKQLLISLAGYASKGTPYSDPLALFSDNVPRPFLFTADTSCTLSGNAHAASDGVDLVAAANSGRGIDLRSTGPVTSAWVVA